MDEFGEYVVEVTEGRRSYEGHTLLGKLRVKRVDGHIMWVEQPVPEFVKVGCIAVEVPDSEYVDIYEG
jgi:hypothetical protein